MKETISHYRIIRELGRGGMGEVYLAEDTRLRRMVALKMLPAAMAGEPRRVQRFLREAHASSALNHPNIAVIHEIGESEDSGPFIAMEYVEGQTLAELIANKPLELNRIIDLGLQIADALDEARSKGVIHRDLKPSNIIINARGHAKVLDFGLAKIASDSSADSGGATDLKSDPALVLGTVQYMSPEQALGREVDHRSDLFSFGVVLYEMATGRHPFSGKSTTETIERIVHAQPDAVARLNYDVPPELERIIRKCLEKDREWRYQSAREIVVDFKSLRRDSESGERATAEVRGHHPRRWLVPAGAIAAVVIAVAGYLAQRGPSSRGQAADPPSMTTVAVLPFSNLAPNPAMEYLQYALPDEVTTILSGTPALALRPFSSTRRLKDSDPIEAGRTLNVDKVITGHYRDDHGALGVTLEAIDVDSNRVVWRNSLSLPSAELIALRNSLSDQLRNGLLPALGMASGREEVTRPRNEEAYALFLKANSLASDPQPTKEAIAMLERALSLDPSYAAAWAEAGRRYYVAGSYGQGGKQALDRSRAAFQRALELDPDSVVAARGLIISSTEKGDLEIAYRQALELVRRRPRNSDARLALSYILRYAGQLEDSARECNIALQVDPNGSLRSCYVPFMLLHDYDRAREFLRLDQGSEWADGHLASILIREGKWAEAAELLRRRPGLRGPGSELLARCLETGRNIPAFDEPDEQSILAGVDSEPLYFFAAEAAVSGAREPTLRLLRGALDRNYSIYPPLDKDPSFDRLRRDPEFLRIRADAIRHHERVTAQLRQIEREAQRSGD